MKISDFVSAQKRTSIEDTLLDSMAANPVRTLERAMSHIGKEPNFATGTAIQLMSRAADRLLKEHYARGQKEARRA